MVARYDGVRLESTVDANVVQAVRFDGKERTRFAVKTDVRSRVTLDGTVPATGSAGGSTSPPPHRPSSTEAIP